MRVMLLVEALSIGGLPNYVLDLARALSEAGDQVVLAFGGEKVPDHLDTRGVDLLQLPSSGYAECARILRGWQPQLVHVHLCSDLGLLGVLEALGVPLLRSFHDYTSVCLRRGRRRFAGDRCQRALGWSCAAYGCLIGAPDPGRRLPRLADLPGKLAERARYRGFDAAIVGSTHMGRVLRINGFDTERIFVVPYFSRFDRYACTPTRECLKLPGVPGTDRPVELLFAGQAVAGKGLGPLVKALAGVRKPWRLTAVTSGPELEGVRQFAEAAGLGARIRFIEWLPGDELARYYAAADLFMLPSVWDDPGPLVGIEALSFGTPVVAFPVGGIPDYVLDGQTGFLARAVAPEALAEALERAVQRAVELKTMGEAGRTMVKELHSRGRHVTGVHAAYGHALALAARSAPVGVAP